ncbi:pentatricopeptide repeat-containing protein At5g67570, chloroplastic [Raphanus sativus]|uniref:Pentatricopeptide repeat-containing protein At5g67570, chloroplastic n=1 Tax=Raphanus sativus TaxID=3726 RepID=A0A9W3BTA1_RAPSA|nr:pentatricopeptide repeat-containing protein At5g67570, chloroplastic [Raphanus sativus]
MDASVVRFSQPPARLPPEFEPDMEKIKRRLLKYGVDPTPKILKNLRKKEIQKHNRRTKRQTESEGETVYTEAQRQSMEEEARFETLKREYKQFTRTVSGDRSGGERSLIVGNPWEGIERVRLKELVGGVRREDLSDGKTRRENLKELKKILEQDLRWVLEDDVDDVEEEYSLVAARNDDVGFDPAKRWRNEGEAVRVLVDRLSSREITEKHWKFVRMMNQSGLQFNEDQMLKIVDRLGRKRSWKQALAVVHWVYSDKKRKHLRSRFVYTKLLSVVGFARRPQEALQIFKQMLGDRQLYPDMAAYHSIAVTLGQAGLLKELLKVIELMRQKPTKLIKNLRQKNWDPVLEPDVVVYNSILNACVPSRQWKAVSWVFIELRKNGLRPNGATYGLAMEVMLESGKYDRVYEFFRKMKSSGEAPKAITYKVLVRALWRENKIEEAVEAVRDMEQKGVIGTGSVYYELACCLCNNGRWREAMLEARRIKRLENCKPLEITFTGLIAASLNGGHVDDCMAIFQYMKDVCDPNIGTVNTMLRVYGRNDMFVEAKELFEEIVREKETHLVPDEYTYSFMLEASARSLQWEYFEHVYKTMILSGYQIDQTKHVPMLIEASRAGKWSLIEHAFDAILEDGEIPHPLFFTEMLCHATAKGDYQRAITLINTVALASFQISEEEWSDLFEENQDWVTRENLQKLSDYILDCDYASEPTVSNLSKSLKSLCGSSSTQPLLAIDVATQSHSEKPEEDLLLHDTAVEEENGAKGEAWEFTETELETLGLEELEIDDDEESSDSDTLSVYDILKEWEESSEKRELNCL